MIFSIKFFEKHKNLSFGFSNHFFFIKRGFKSKFYINLNNILKILAIRIFIGLILQIVPMTQRIHDLPESCRKPFRFFVDFIVAQESVGRFLIASNTQTVARAEGKLKLKIVKKSKRYLKL